jgi:hypothetical protein
MQRGCDTEALEALERNELPTERQEAVQAHALTCPSCGRELAWLRAEKALFAQPEEPASMDRLWAGIEGRLQPRAAGPGPYRAVALVPPPRPRGRMALGAGLLAVGLLAGAAAATLALRFEVRRHPNSIQLTHRGDPNPPPSSATLRDQLPVQGPVELSLETFSADVELVPGDPHRVTVRVEDGSVRQVRLVQGSGNRVAVRFDGDNALGSGRVSLELPPGSCSVVRTRSGDITAGDMQGDVSVHTTSGDVRLGRVASLQVQATSGDVEARAVSGSADVRTVSGDITVAQTSGPGARFEAESASGSLAWTGLCGAGCAFRFRTVSGDTRLTLGAQSSLRLEFQTVSGELRDNVGLTDGRLGAGEGVVAVTSTSGDLTLRR